MGTQGADLQTHEAIAAEPAAMSGVSGPPTLLTHGLLNAAQVLALQRTAGNARVARYLQGAQTAVVARRLTIQSGAGRAGGPQLTTRLIERLNAVSHALEFLPEGNELHARLRPGRTAADLSDFERRMAQYVDMPGIAAPRGGGGPARSTDIPLRLTTRHGTSGSGSGSFHMDGDNLDDGYVDVDDLTACDDDAFKELLIHFITERRAVPNYRRRVGAGHMGEFDMAHREGEHAELANLQAELGDPTLRGPRTTDNGRDAGGRMLKVFTSRRGYRVESLFTDRGGGVFAGRMTVIRGHDRFTVQQWMAGPGPALAAEWHEREAAAGAGH